MRGSLPVCPFARGWGSGGGVYTNGAFASFTRHMYHDPTDRYGAHFAPIPSACFGVGISGSPYATCIPCRTPRSPTGSTSGRCKLNIRNMCADHSPRPRTATSRVVIPRDEIAQMQVSDNSFMPLDLLKPLGERERIELLKYLMSQ